MELYWIMFSRVFGIGSAKHSNPTTKKCINFLQLNSVHKFSPDLFHVQSTCKNKKGMSVPAHTRRHTREYRYNSTHS
jgi:hypothetical protein